MCYLSLSISLASPTLLTELKSLSDYKGDIEKEISNTFTDKNDSFFVALECIEKEILNTEDYTFYSSIPYTTIFDDKIIAFLETGEFKTQIQAYIQKYDELLNQSKILKKNFNHYHATTVHRNLKDNNFFKAQHSINLSIEGKKEEVVTEKDFFEKIEREKERISSDSSLKKIFDSIDKKISNQQLRDFRDYLFENQEILTELGNLNVLKQKIWIAHLKKRESLFLKLLKEYRNSQKEIGYIIAQAKSEKTEWEKVIDIFNMRFYVPFKLGIKNKEDIVLQKETLPSIHYYFENREESVEETLLFKVLSQGEKRALYLLNIIFEIESRRRQNMKTLLIIDDIADSFDYKNKYAIIEYLKEISEDNCFNSIILTHNFDFYRTVQERIGMEKYSKSYMALKDDEKTNLIKLKYKYISNPFKEWKSNLDDATRFIASITFARNIAEYIGDNDNFNKLTSLLHIKPDTEDYTIEKVEEIYKLIFKDLNSINLENKEMKLLDLIFNIADKLSDDVSEVGLNLENKIVLSIAIRLYAEKFMIAKINNENFVNLIKSSQTGKLFGQFKKNFPNEEENLKILERVNIMTPENIHLNSFMFEPILDISDCHLKDLYRQVKLLVENRANSFIQNK